MIWMGWLPTYIAFNSLCAAAGRMWCVSECVLLSQSQGSVAVLLAVGSEGCSTTKGPHPLGQTQPCTCSQPESGWCRLF